jgi:hypothetical protein
MRVVPISIADGRFLQFCRLFVHGRVGFHQAVPVFFHQSVTNTSGIHGKETSPTARCLAEYLSFDQFIR